MVNDLNLQPVEQLEMPDLEPAPVKPKAKRRGKTGGKKPVSKNPLFIRQMMAGHAMLALAVPEMAIDELEATSLVNSLCDVLALYNLNVSKEMSAWGALVAVSATIYIPRLLLIRARLMSEREKLAKREDEVRQRDYDPPPENGAPVQFVINDDYEIGL